MDPLCEVRQRLASMIARGRMTEREAAEAIAFFDELSEKEVRGEITPEQALDQTIEFGLGQLRRRMS